MGDTVLIVRPLWPVLLRAAGLLAGEGYRVEESSSWGRLLDPRLSCAGLSGVFLGEHGPAAEEMEVVRKFRARNGALGVPLVLVGGMGALLRAERFRASGVDVVVPADVSPTALLEQARPLLRYGALYRSLAEANRELKELSLRDELTGLPNRRHFSLDLARNVEMARRIGRALSCILVDIDGFKEVNDAYGHAQGDAVIRQFGEVLDRAKRTYDTVARLGGDEFGWLLVDADPARALQAAERARRVIEGNPFVASGKRLRLTATFGVASTAPGTPSSGDDLVGNADRALYWGKESGKNVVRAYPPARTFADAKTDSDIS